MHISHRLASQEGVRPVLKDAHRFCDADVAIRLPRRMSATRSVSSGLRQGRDTNATAEG
jgi:hypothetical protein